MPSSFSIANVSLWSLVQLGRGRSELRTMIHWLDIADPMHYIEVDKSCVKVGNKVWRRTIWKDCSDNGWIATMSKLFLRLLAVRAPASVSVVAMSVSRVNVNGLAAVAGGQVRTAVELSTASMPECWFWGHAVLPTV